MSAVAVKAAGLPVPGRIQSQTQARLAVPGLMQSQAQAQTQAQTPVQAQAQAQTRARASTPPNVVGIGAGPDGCASLDVDTTAQPGLRSDARANGSDVEKVGGAHPNGSDVEKAGGAHLNGNDVEKAGGAHPNGNDVEKVGGAHPNGEDVEKAGDASKACLPSLSCGMGKGTRAAVSGGAEKAGDGTEKAGGGMGKATRAAVSVNAEKAGGSVEKAGRGAKTPWGGAGGFSVSGPPWLPPGHALCHIERALRSGVECEVRAV